MNNDIIKDFITGKIFVNTGAEKNRQAVEKYLVNEKGYKPDDIGVDVPISAVAGEKQYRSFVDLLVCVDNRPVMVIKCAAGSLDSRYREIVSAGRILRASPVPLAVASDGKTAVIWETVTGKKTGEGLFAIPDRGRAVKYLAAAKDFRMPESRLEKERLIFSSYDSMNVNSARTSDKHGKY